MYSEVITHYSAGGWMIWPMFFVTPILWYALGYRFVIMNKGLAKHNVRMIIREYEKDPAQSNSSKSMIHLAVKKSFVLREKAAIPLRPYLDESFSELSAETNRYGTLIRTIVYVAPLMGLLGTVTGMIETFDSLQDMTLHSASGGIAGGISQALITTQLGLTIAIPGLLLNVFLDKRKEQIERELNQLKDIICSRS